MMGIVLFWIHDLSPGRARTYTLVDHTTDLVARTIGLATVPLLRPLRRRVLQLLADVRQKTADSPAGAAATDATPLGVTSADIRIGGTSADADAALR
jgi:hypothetical protein